VVFFVILFLLLCSLFSFISFTFHFNKFATNYLKLTTSHTRIILVFLAINKQIVIVVNLQYDKKNNSIGVGQKVKVKVRACASFC